MDFKSHTETNKNGVISIVLDSSLLVDSGQYGKITIHEIFPFSGAFQYSQAGIEDEQFIVAFPSADQGFPTIDLKELKVLLKNPSSEKQGMDLVICTLLDRLF